MVIDDISITPLSIINTTGGKVLHAMKNNESSFASFGEAYFSEIEPNAIKAWKRHRKMTLNLIVPIGKIRFVMFDDRKEAKNQFQEIIISRKNYYRLTVPPMIWIGFQSLSYNNSMLLNIASILHNPKEFDRKNISEIEFDWSKYK
jgi:dTDP-4-dehydrorhamnose 3,5-epimerase